MTTTSHGSSLEDLLVAGCSQGPVGTLRPPSDKSISLRALLLSALTDAETHVTSCLESDDTTAMVTSLMRLGASVRRETRHSGSLFVRGDVRLAREPVAIDAGESGTTARLLLGALAGSEREIVLDGRGSLRSRPMKRVVLPLARMGVSFAEPTRDRLPLRFVGRKRLVAMNHRLEVASAQVKSAILLAGLCAEGVTQVEEPGASRDHTERMFRTFGVEIEARGGILRLRGPQALRAPLTAIDVPADLSSALYSSVAALVLPAARVELVDVGINPTRAGGLAVLESMGARVARGEARSACGEDVARLTFESSSLVGVEVPAAAFPTLLDDIPVLAVAAACAEGGTTTFHGVSELRVKESDRIESIAAMLRAFGVPVRTSPDSLAIEGGAKLRAGDVDSHGDHRIALAATVLALAAPGESRIRGFSCAAKSYPGFRVDLLALGIDAERLREVGASSAT